MEQIDLQLQTADYMSETIVAKLENQKNVLWLVPGGSSIEVALLVAKALAGKDLSHLTMTLTDERYGEVGHADSNWQQILDGGFDLPGAKLIPILTGDTIVETVDTFGDIITAALKEADFSLGFFGIGLDGHTAGILPDSLAVSVSMPTVGYDAGNFQRITITPSIIATLDEAVVYAVGENKWPIIEQLKSDIDIVKQPAQALKEAKKLTIFSDYKGAI